MYTIESIFNQRLKKVIHNLFFFTRRVMNSCKFINSCHSIKLPHAMTELHERASWTFLAHTEFRVFQIAEVTICRILFCRVLYMSFNWHDTVKLRQLQMLQLKQKKNFFHWMIPISFLLYTLLFLPQIRFASVELWVLVMEKIKPWNWAFAFDTCISLVSWIVWMALYPSSGSLNDLECLESLIGPTIFSRMCLASIVHVHCSR